jgi:RNA polymerase sigma factor (sigma-70 family)
LIQARGARIFNPDAITHESGISAEPSRCESLRTAADGLGDAEVVLWTSAMVRGDSAAYEAIFLARCAFVEREARRRLGSRKDLTEDVAQEAWLRVARRPLAFPGVQSLDAWLRRVVRSAAVDMLRSELSRRARESEAARDRGEALRFLDDYDLLEALRREVDSIEGLTQEERALFELKSRTDATTARLASWLGIGRAAVDSKLRRAAERARALKSEQVGEQDKRRQAWTR